MSKLFDAMVTESNNTQVIANVEAKKFNFDDFMDFELPTVSYFIKKYGAAKYTVTDITNEAKFIRFTGKLEYADGEVTTNVEYRQYTVKKDDTVMSFESVAFGLRPICQQVECTTFAKVLNKLNTEGQITLDVEICQNEDTKLTEFVYSTNKIAEIRSARK